MIHVIAVLTAHPGQREALLAVFRANIPAVLAEEGCIEYVPVVDAPGSPAPLGPDAFMVVEKWASFEALKAHAASPHMVEYGRASAHLTADLVIHVLTAA
jgi:quinol monooxygenase YgiN